MPQASDDQVEKREPIVGEYFSEEISGMVVVNEQ